MTINRKISSLEFEYLTKLEPYINENDQNSKKTFKYALIDSVEGVFGDKWFNLSERTRQSIEYICFLSIERGFVYASPDHIATRFKIGRSTVYEALKLLRDEDILYKANRTSKKQNGLGCSVHFFTIHPYFEQINSFLNLGWKAEGKPERIAEKSEMASVTTNDSENIMPTLLLPTHYKQENNRDIQSNVSPMSSKLFVKYVPKEINELYAEIFDFRLRSIWQKITQAWKTINQSILTRDDLITIGANIIKRIYQLWKERMRVNEEMTVDEMCAFAYKSALETFCNALGALHMEEYLEDGRVGDRSISNSRKNITKLPNDRSSRKINRNADNDRKNIQHRKREIRLEQLEEAKRYIPTLEDIYLRQHPNDSLETVMEGVLQAIKEKYELLDRHDLSSLEQSYMKYTGQTHLIDEYLVMLDERSTKMIEIIESGSVGSSVGYIGNNKITFDDEYPF